MYPSSSSSSSQKSTNSSGLIRYGSAPGSFLATAVDSVIGGGGGDRDSVSAFRSNNSLLGHYFSGDSSCLTSESACKVNSSSSDLKDGTAGGGLQRSYGLNHIGSVGDFANVANLKSSGNSSALVRQRSSPAGFAGFSVTRGTGNFNSPGGSNSGHGVSRLKSQLSFTSQDSLSQISKASENNLDGGSSSSGHQNAMHSYATASFGMDSWDNTNSIAFSALPNKRAKNIDGEYFSCFNGLESQYSMPQTTLEMGALDKLLRIPEDSVPCKIRAKRGCATHPRSIAERERRTRISGKLKKLQDLVPNMDKQTSYADMLDLAVQHIKGLQNQVQKLHKELENCKCGCKPTT